MKRSWQPIQLLLPLHHLLWGGGSASVSDSPGRVLVRGVLAALLPEVVAVALADAVAPVERQRREWDGVGVALAALGLATGHPDAPMPEKGTAG